jgi:transcriptional regulator with XRE-family HTH domain
MTEAAMDRSRTRQGRAAARNASDAYRSIGSELRNAREDAGLSLSATAAAAGIAKSYLHGIEDGRRRPSTDTLTSLAAALSGRIWLRFEPGTGPRLRDHLQASMLAGLLPILHPRWKRFLEVEVNRPVRGAIDLVLDDPDAAVIVASEVHSRLERLEQQIRWAKAKADAIATGGAHELAQVFDRGAAVTVSRMLVLRVTSATRQLASIYGDVLATAYPASHEDAVRSLTTNAPWPGPAIVWMRVDSGRASIATRPPRLGGRSR